VCELSSKVKYYLVIIMAAHSVLFGQSINDLGVMGGSGVVMTPTTSVNAVSQFRLDMVHLNFTHAGRNALYGYNLTSGLSPNLEFFAKFQMGETRTSLWQSFTGFGGKLVLPFGLPYLDQAALWGELVSTPLEDSMVFYPATIYRSAFVLRPTLLNSIRANVILGAANSGGENGFLGGLNASIALSQSVKFGAEFIYGYYHKQDKQELLNITYRPISNVCLQLAPGYYQAPEASSWMVSAGITVSTADIDFMPKPKPKETIVIPSIDDLEKQMNEEKKKD
jgi:hypothetical protein